MIPGEVILKTDEISCNVGRLASKIKVKNTGDRPVQVGSHFHFFEVNDALEFNREEGYGRRLNIPAGTAVRFEPGDEKEVELIPYAGERRVYGFNGKTNGSVEGGCK